ncbi:MAG: SDR family oxidoreductase [Candidatus Saganbacteria bacterium]|nr:SDR family oxidoreductase [Candidatus Saganbacteria bacterium]
MKNYLDKFKLKGKKAVVAGGAGLIGRQIVVSFAQAGAHVVIADISEKEGKAFAAELRTKNYNVEFIVFDVTALEILQENIIGLGKIDIWVNSAYPRTSDWSNKVEDISVESWRKNIDIQLNSYSLISKFVAESMKESGGSIVNLGSIYGVVGPDFTVYEGTDITVPMAYAAIKGGIVNLGRYLASYFGKYNIRVNSICLGGVFDNQDPIFVNSYSKKVPLGRMAKADDIACAALFLASDASSYITGATIMVDGGWTSV